jgi:hypothetical protein
LGDSFFRKQIHEPEIVVGNVMFHGAYPDGLAFVPQNAVAFAETFMRADEGTDHRKGIVSKEHLPRLSDLSFEKHGDHLRNGGTYGASLDALGIDALKTSFRFLNDLGSHKKHSLYFWCDPYMGKNGNSFG